MDFAYTLAHYLYPRYSNNHKAKLLHSSTLFLLTLFLIVYQLVLQVLPLSRVGVLGYAASISLDEVVRLTNQKRSEAGIEALTYSGSLSQAAKLKGEHMLQYDYWAHVAPDGTEPWKFFGDVGYKYRYAGENLARDFSSAQSAIDAWIASPSHRDNMLAVKYKEIGVAVVEGDLGGVDTTIIVQLFGSQLGDTTAQIPAAQAKPLATSAPAPTVIATITPTLVSAIAIVSPQPPEKESALVSAPGKAEEKAGGLRVLISPFQTTRGISIVTTMVLLGVMVIDGIVVARRKLPRIGGRTFAHVAFLGMVLAILLIARAGEIL